MRPSKAEQGRACDASCPGCNAPLISRHPKEADKRTHFAHDSRHPEASKKDIESCPFNSQLAIALMARALASDLSGESLSSPPLRAYVSCKLCSSKIYDDTVSMKNPIFIENAESSCAKLGANFDLKINFENASVLVWLSYDDRPLPDIKFNELKETGVIKIDVNSFDFFRFKKGIESFKASVKNFLLKDGKREWVYHPSKNKRATKKAKEEQHNCVVFECFKCKSKWFHNVKETPQCPNRCAIHYCKKSSHQPSISYEDKLIIS
jgi:hypothetical protein